MFILCQMAWHVCLLHFGSKIFQSIQYCLFPFQRMLDPLDLWSTNLMETFLRNWNGPEFVTFDLTSAETGKKERKGEYSCFVEVFPLSCQHEQIWFSVVSQLTNCVDEWHDLVSLIYFLGDGGIVWYAQRWKSIVRQRHNYFQGNLLTFHHRLHILHMYMYTYTVRI